MRRPNRNPPDSRATPARRTPLASTAPSPTASSRRAASSSVVSSVLNSASQRVASHRRGAWVGLLTVVLLLSAGSTACAEPQVEFELCTAPGFPPAAAQEWLRALSGLNLDGLRIRAAQGAEKVRIETTGEGRFARHKVTGILVGRDELRLPGGAFTMSDKAKLSQWLEKLKVGGGESVTAKTAAFGLTGKQLVELHTALAARTPFTTAKRPAVDVVRQLATRIPVPLVVAPDVRGRFADETVADELEGVSVGTALAAVVRPLGLALTPVVEAAQVRLVVVDSAAAKEAWPVGWPPQGTPGEIAPELLKFLDVEIDDTPLQETLGVLQQRLELPMLFDHNGLARHGVDLEKTKVTIGRGRTYYSKILDQALGKARLKYELRVDEAERPFLWISSKLD